MFIKLHYIKSCKYIHIMLYLLSKYLVKLSVISFYQSKVSAKASVFIRLTS